MNLVFNCYPNGKTKAVTFSYDDIDRGDLRMLETMDRYGAKCTINVNSSWVGVSYKLTKEELQDISTRHELACHGYRHAWMGHDNGYAPLGSTVGELWEDKKLVEAISGRPVIGMAYPYGTHAINEDVRHLADSCGLRYGRGTLATGSFDLPKDFTLWEPTCHHDGCMELLPKFLEWPLYWKPMPLFYIWGHSFEYRENNTWNILEEVLEGLSKDRNIWYATNGEIYEYLTAMRNLRVSADNTMVYNPSNISVFATADGEVTELKPGMNRL